MKRRLTLFVIGLLIGAAVAGCATIHGLGTDLQNWTERNVTPTDKE